MGFDSGDYSAIPGLGFVEGLLGIPDEQLYGRKPTVPTFREINYRPGREQRKAIRDNLRNFKDVKKLASKINVFSVAELRTMLEKAIPDFRRMMKSGSARTVDLLENKSFAEMLQGKLPKDVQEQIQNSAAAAGIGGGYAGGGMTPNSMLGNLYLRDIGLNSYQAIEKGAELTAASIGAAERWMANAKALAVPAQFDATSMFLNPADRVKQKVAVDQLNATNSWARNWLAAQIDAAPNPAARGAMDTQFSTLGMVLGAAGGILGGLTGGGGGGGGNTQYSGTYHPNYMPTQSAPTQPGPGQPGYVTPLG